MKAYPLLVRKRIIELYEQEKPTKEIAELFGICRSGTRRVKQQLRERGTIEPLPRERRT
jgi:DNA invertase Pin-like site-specific DNA recombinase